MWLIHLNGDHNDLFSAMEVNKCIRKHPSYMRSTAYFATLYIVIVLRYMSGILSNTLSWRGHWIAKLIAEYATEELTSRVVPYIVLREVAHEMVCLSESYQGLNFHKRH